MLIARAANEQQVYSVYLAALWLLFLDKALLKCACLKSKLNEELILSWNPKRYALLANHCALKPYLDW